MAAARVCTFDTAHCGGVNDAQLDYYGRRVATASSDHTVRVFDVASETPVFQTELKGHDGPVWQVSWAHPKFGSLLASCGNDRRLIIWREQTAAQPRGQYAQQGQQGQDWQMVYKSEDFPAAVNSAAWAPWEYGLFLACACGDGSISVISHGDDGQWSRQDFPAHINGANAVSWAPAATPAVMATGPGTGGRGGPGASGKGPMRIVSGGSDNQVKIWAYDPTVQSWVERSMRGGQSANQQQQQGEDPEVPGHSNIVRDVSWRPSVGTPGDLIASCSEDGTVILWSQETEADGQNFKCQQRLEIGQPVWRVAWSVTGSILACASGDNTVTLFKESLDGTWEKQQQLDENAPPPPSPQQNQLNSQEPYLDSQNLPPANGQYNIQPMAGNGGYIESQQQLQHPPQLQQQQQASYPQQQQQQIPQQHGYGQSSAPGQMSQQQNATLQSSHPPPPPSHNWQQPPQQQQQQQYQQHPSMGQQSLGGPPTYQQPPHSAYGGGGSQASPPPPQEGGYQQQGPYGGHIQQQGGQQQHHSAYGGQDQYQKHAGGSHGAYPPYGSHSPPPSGHQGPPQQQNYQQSWQ